MSADVDARWTMAYAAALGDTASHFFDTAKRSDVLAHPLFPVCFEWPLFLSDRHLPTSPKLAPDERLRGVHATHDLHLHRPVRAGIEVMTHATLVRLEARRPGAYQVVRLDSVDAAGEPVCTTYYGSLFRGVALEGGDRVEAEGEPEQPPAPAGEPTSEAPLEVAAGLAHVYTECARIWNPIHTDAAVAAKAGLRGIILHGTATLALAVSGVVEHVLGGDSQAVARVAGRFGAMVPMPSRCTLRIWPRQDRGIPFEVRNETGEAALRGGWIETRSGD